MMDRFGGVERALLLVMNEQAMSDRRNVFLRSLRNEGSEVYFKMNVEVYTRM